MGNQKSTRVLRSPTKEQKISFDYYYLSVDEKFFLHRRLQKFGVKVGYFLASPQSAVYFFLGPSILVSSSSSRVIKSYKKRYKKKKKNNIIHSP